MFRRQSWIGRASAALLLVATVSTGSLVLPHADERDADCNPILVAHDASAHRIGPDAKPAAAHTEHCFLCHSLRSFYPAFDTFEQHHDAPGAEPLHIARIDRARLLAWTLVPGRAPPV
jgi:hypothetical protein